MRNGAVVAEVLSSAASSVELDTLPCVPAGRGTLCVYWQRHHRHILCITTRTCLAFVGKSWEKEKSAKESESEKIASLL